jgi:hypothetical protein
MDETEEQDVEVKEVEEPLPDIVEKKEIVPEATPVEKETGLASMKETIAEYKETTNFGIGSENKISFADADTVVDVTGNSSVVNAPKDEKNLEEIEKARALVKQEEEDDEEDERLTIGGPVKLDVIDINDLNKPSVDLKPPIVLDFEVLT